MRLSLLLAILLPVTFTRTAEAVILLSGDTNIINPTVGTSGQAVNLGNVQFFTNILEGEDSVPIQQTSGGGVVSPANTGMALNTFYDKRLYSLLFTPKSRLLNHDSFLTLNSLLSTLSSLGTVF